MGRAYPVHLSLAGQPVLMVGAGHVAQRRVARLLDAGAVLHVVAPEASDALQASARDGALRWSERRFEEPDCDGMRLVFAATGDLEVNAQVERAARTAGALVNRADAPGRCDFLVPATAESSSCTVSLSTEGRAPSAARRLARELGRWLNGGPDRFVQAVEQARRQLGGTARAAEQLRALADGPLFDACMRSDLGAITALLHAATEGEEPHG